MHTTIMFEDNAKVMQQRRFHDFYYSIIIKKKRNETAATKRRTKPEHSPISQKRKYTRFKLNVTITAPTL